MSADVMPNTEITSPCIRQCCLDENDICLGCQRSLDEILCWAQSSDQEKQNILERCAKRKSEFKPKV